VVSEKPGSLTEKVLPLSPVAKTQCPPYLTFKMTYLLAVLKASTQAYPVYGYP